MISLCICVVIEGTRTHVFGELGIGDYKSPF